ncbi:hypothetical protein [Amycolatopsis sp. lyj-346]|uniref:hypothetical protein n=1 Tax=Amycolatopsis sp. lyj-346 TaxID=2789289 RepID=UPI003978E8E4
MRYAQPSRRQVEMAAEELDFDVFADSGSLAADVAQFVSVDLLAGVDRRSCAEQARAAAWLDEVA